MERVGSNWVSDTLRPVTGQHNEPFRQQVSAAHPMSALNPGISPDDAVGRFGPYGRHWLVTFAVGKHAAERQVIKETSLFFALPGLLSLFPDSPVGVLTRSPIGVASSFARSDLFRRWDYRARYRQMAAGRVPRSAAACPGMPTPRSSPGSPGSGPAPSPTRSGPASPGGSRRTACCATPRPSLSRRPAAAPP